ncbi:hypothetical protein [Helicobacter cetorum]|uniref:hypothetical protein n=1 Tax=Helicobacter cetorum TaxID=138563 RepID=UPI0018F7F471|nr:hypothetical protein [Helicobacter cetorum]
MKTNLFKGLGALSLSLAMPLFGGAPINVSIKTENKFSDITNNFFQQSYLNIQSNVDNIIIQNVELNRGNCKNEVYDTLMKKIGYTDSYTSLRNYENKRAKILGQLENLKYFMKESAEDASLAGFETSEHIKDAKTIIKNNENFQKQLKAINTYDELRKKLNDENSGFPNSLDIVFRGNPPKSKELYSLMFFDRSIAILFGLSEDSDENIRNEWIESYELHKRIGDVGGCTVGDFGNMTPYLVLKDCVSSGNASYEYYLNDYVKNVIGDKDYNMLTDRDNWMKNIKIWKSLSAEEKDKTRQELEKQFKELNQKILTAYLQKYKEFTLNQSNAIIKEQQIELSKLYKKKQQEQQESQQEYQQQQQKDIKYQKELTQKLAQVEQKIKEMKEQGNTIKAPLKFGEVFKEPITCDSLKEAKIKTNKGTYTFSF